MSIIWRSAVVMASARLPRMIDIAVNLSDPMYQGVYHGKQAHTSDYDDVLQRAFDIGVEKMVASGGSLTDSREMLKLAAVNDRVFCTVGCHPTRCSEFEQTVGLTPEGYLEQLLQLAEEGKHAGQVVAVGECGLDYDRLHFCPKDHQLKYFEWQLGLAEKTNLPLFLHCRKAFDDLAAILKRNRSKFSSGVLHTFDGSFEQAQEAISMGLYIGINGCSLKTEDNVKVVKSLPLDRILIETDAPWCEIRPSHASAPYVSTHFPAKKKERWENGVGVKSRNEPRNLVQVLEVIAALHSINLLELSEKIYHNTCTLFGWELI